jgi:hypothetical protein
MILYRAASSRPSSLTGSKQAGSKQAGSKQAGSTQAGDVQHLKDERLAKKKKSATTYLAPTHFNPVAKASAAVVSYCRQAGYSAVMARYWNNWRDRASTNAQPSSTRW